jgi:hypothetical protein
VGDELALHHLPDGHVHAVDLPVEVQAEVVLRLVPLRRAGVRRQRRKRAVERTFSRRVCSGCLGMASAERERGPLWRRLSCRPETGCSVDDCDELASAALDGIIASA